MVKNVNTVQTLKKLTTARKLKILKIKFVIMIYIAAFEFNKLTKENCIERFEQAKLATKDDIVDFAEKPYFDEKLISINKKVTSSKQNMRWLKRN